MERSCCPASLSNAPDKMGSSFCNVSRLIIWSVLPSTDCNLHRTPLMPSSTGWGPNLIICGQQKGWRGVVGGFDVFWKGGGGHWGEGSLQRWGSLRCRLPQNYPLRIGYYHLSQARGVHWSCQIVPPVMCVAQPAHNERYAANLHGADAHHALVLLFRERVCV